MMCKTRSRQLFLASGKALAGCHFCWSTELAAASVLLERQLHSNTHFIGRSLAREAYRGHLPVGGVNRVILFLPPWHKFETAAAKRACVVRRGACVARRVARDGQL